MCNEPFFGHQSLILTKEPTLTQIAMDHLGRDNKKQALSEMKEDLYIVQ